MPQRSRNSCKLFCLFSFSSAAKSGEERRLLLTRRCACALIVECSTKSVPCTPHVERRAEQVLCLLTAAAASTTDWSCRAYQENKREKNLGYLSLVGAFKSQGRFNIHSNTSKTCFSCLSTGEMVGHSKIQGADGDFDFGPGQKWSQSTVIQCSRSFMFGVWGIHSYQIYGGHWQRLVIPKNMTSRRRSYSLGNPILRGYKIKTNFVSKRGWKVLINDFFSRQCFLMQ